MVGVERFELSTFWSQAGCSAQTELRPDNGVTDGSRTRDLRLGKPMFFLLNYCHKFVTRGIAARGGGFLMTNGAPDRTRTCTVRTLIPFPLPGLGYWSLWSGIRDSNPNLQFGRLICLAVTPMPLMPARIPGRKHLLTSRHH